MHFALRLLADEGLQVPDRIPEGVGRLWIEGVNFRLQVLVGSSRVIPRCCVLP